MNPVFWRDVHPAVFPSVPQQDGDTADISASSFKRKPFPTGTWSQSLPRLLLHTSVRPHKVLRGIKCQNMISLSDVMGRFSCFQKFCSKYQKSNTVCTWFNPAEASRQLHLASKPSVGKCAGQQPLNLFSDHVIFSNIYRLDIMITLFPMRVVMSLHYCYKHLWDWTWKKLFAQLHFAFAGGTGTTPVNKARAWALMMPEAHEV